MTSESPSNFRCINDACGRGFPRAVRFCPWCGTGQVAAPARPAAAPPAPVAPPVAPAASPAPAPAPAVSPAPPAPMPPSPPAAATTAAPRPGPTQPRYQQPQPAAGVPRPPGGGSSAGPSLPPPRKPVGKGTWLFVALLLLAIWFLVKPGDPSKALDGKVDDAIALTKECRIADARAALKDLRGDKADAAQLARLQKAIAASAPACEKKSQRARAWTDTRAALEAALAGNAPDKASARLSAFVKRWNDDEQTREWRERIDLRRAEKLLDDANACLARKDRACVEAKLNAAGKLDRPETRPRIEALRESLSRMLESTLLEGAAQGAPAAAQADPASPAGQGGYPPPLSATPPRAVPAPVSAAVATTGGGEARRLRADAERELAQGNYRSAIGLAGQCAAQGGGDCAGLREKAARLEREQHACMQAGRQWIGQRCE